MKPKKYNGLKEYLWFPTGECWDYGKNKFRKPIITSRGYSAYNLRLDEGVIKQVLIHRILAELYINNPNKKPQVNHINGIKTDYSLDNLEWVTAKENNAHAIYTGLREVARGERIKCSKLKAVQIPDIRRKIISGNFSRRDIANMYGVGVSTIDDIAHNRTWRHVKNE